MADAKGKSIYYIVGFGLLAIVIGSGLSYVISERQSENKKTT